MRFRFRASDSQCNSVHEKIEKQRRPMKKPRNFEKKKRLAAGRKLKTFPSMKGLSDLDTGTRMKCAGFTKAIVRIRMRSFIKELPVFRCRWKRC